MAAASCMGNGCLGGGKNLIKVWGQCWPGAMSRHSILLLILLV